MRELSSTRRRQASRIATDLSDLDPQRGASPDPLSIWACLRWWVGHCRLSSHCPPRFVATRSNSHRANACGSIAEKPQLYMDAINAAVTAASSRGRILDIGAEAKRIAKAIGLSPIITARDLFEAGIAARGSTWHSPIHKLD